MERTGRAVARWPCLACRSRSRRRRAGGSGIGVIRATEAAVGGRRTARSRAAPRSGDQAKQLPQLTGALGGPGADGQRSLAAGRPEAGRFWVGGRDYDEKDELDFYAEFDLVEQAFADRSLLRRRLYRERVLHYLDDDTVTPHVFRRLAARDVAHASAVFRTLLRRPGYAWEHDGEPLLRERKASYSPARPVRRRV